MLSLLGWLNGITVMGCVIFTSIFGIWLFYKSKKSNANLLSYLSLTIFFGGLYYLGLVCDFLTILLTGNNLDTTYGLPGILTHMWLAPTVFFAMYLGAELMIPKKKRYILFIYLFLCIIYEIFLFLDRKDCFFYIEPTNPGEDLIVTIMVVSFLQIFFGIYLNSILIFLGFGLLLKSIRSRGLLRKKFLLLFIGFYSFYTFRFIEGSYSVIPLIFIRISSLVSFGFMYLGLRTLKTKPIIKIEKERGESEEIERISYENIPNLKDLIRNYVFYQLKAIQNDFKNIGLEDLDEKIKNQLNTKIDKFVNYLKLEGHLLTQFQIEILKDDCLKESKPIRDELRKLIEESLERERIRKEREEQERILREKVEVTKELFGREIIKEEDIKKIEEYKTIDEEIDELLKQYSAWEKNEKFKK